MAMGFDNPLNRVPLNLALLGMLAQAARQQRGAATRSAAQRLMDIGTLSAQSGAEQAKIIERANARDAELLAQGSENFSRSFEAGLQRSADEKRQAEALAAEAERQNAALDAADRRSAEEQAAEYSRQKESQRFTAEQNALSRSASAKQFFAQLLSGQGRFAVEEAGRQADRDRAEMQFNAQMKETRDARESQEKYQKALLDLEKKKLGITQDKSEKSAGIALADDTVRNLITPDKNGNLPSADVRLRVAQNYLTQLPGLLEGETDQKVRTYLMLKAEAIKKLMPSLAEGAGQRRWGFLEPQTESSSPSGYTRVAPFLMTAGMPDLPAPAASNPQNDGQGLSLAERLAILGL